MNDIHEINTYTHTHTHTYTHIYIYRLLYYTDACAYSHLERVWVAIGMYIPLSLFHPA